MPGLDPSLVLRHRPARRIPRPVTRGCGATRDQAEADSSSGYAQPPLGSDHKQWADPPAVICSTLTFPKITHGPAKSRYVEAHCPDDGRRCMPRTMRLLHRVAKRRR